MVLPAVSAHTDGGIVPRNIAGDPLQHEGMPLHRSSEIYGLLVLLA